jgi:hypothetical protein
MLYCKTAYSGISSDKQEILNAAIKNSNQKNVILDLRQLKEVISQLGKFKKLNPEAKTLLKETPLNKWVIAFKDLAQQEELKEEPGENKAKEDLFLRHNELNWVKKDSEDLGRKLRGRF